jgi:hypothetical protein
MVITRHFVVLHLPRTGGNFVQKICEHHLPSDWLVSHSLGSHAGWEHIPPDYAHLPRFGAVRNPWDWYVSWDSYMRAVVERPTLQRRENPLWQIASDGGRRDFRETVAGILSGAAEHPAARRIRDQDVDLLTLRHRRIFGHAAERNTMTVGKCESLRFDFTAFLTAHDVPVPDEFIEAVRTSAPRNTSERGPYRDYYDDELRDLVAHRGRYIIDRYDYAF